MSNTNAIFFYEILVFLIKIINTNIFYFQIVTTHYSHVYLFLKKRRSNVYFFSMITIL